MLQYCDTKNVLRFGLSVHCLRIFDRWNLFLLRSSNNWIFFDCLLGPSLLMFYVIQQRSLHELDEINSLLVHIDWLAH